MGKSNWIVVSHWMGSLGRRVGCVEAGDGRKRPNFIQVIRSIFLGPAKSTNATAYQILAWNMYIVQPEVLHKV